MEVVVRVKRSELREMDFDGLRLKNDIITRLDNEDEGPLYVGYNVTATVTEDI